MKGQLNKKDNQTATTAAGSFAANHISVQKKLTVGAVNDPMEHEADAMADTVMRMPIAPQNIVQRKEIFIQREYDDTKEEGEGEEKEQSGSTEKNEAPVATQPVADEPEHVQRKPLVSFIQKKEKGEGGTANDAITNQINTTRGNGNQMSGVTKSFMESRFGTDFSNVRIHTGDYAVQMSRDLNAQAFTVGSDVYFNQGKFAPESNSGKHLLAHELTHTIQQTGSIVQPKKATPTQGEKVQRSFFGDLWSGIKSAASTVWGGIKKGASAAWSGIKAGASAVWGGIKTVGTKAWDVIKDAGAWVADFITWMPTRLWRLVKHLVEGVKDAALWIADVVQVIKGDEGLLHWLGRAAKGGGAWVGRFLAKVLDVVGFGEFWTLVTNIIKANTRSLTETERKEAQKVYGGVINYWQVRIDEHSLISVIGAAAKKSSGMGVTTAHTINFNKKINATAGSSDMAWLIHEMGHVAQYTTVGLQYMGEAIHAQSTKEGYDYNETDLASKDLKDFNREQQPDILRNYYLQVLYGMPPSAFSADYVKMKNQAQQGMF